MIYVLFLISTGCGVGAGLALSNRNLKLSSRLLAVCWLVLLYLSCFIDS